MEIIQISVADDLANWNLRPPPADIPVVLDVAFLIQIPDIYFVFDARLPMHAILVTSENFTHLFRGRGGPTLWILASRGLLLKT